MYWKVKISEATELSKFGRNIEALAIYETFFSQKAITEERIITLQNQHFILKNMSIFINDANQYHKKIFEIENILRTIINDKSIKLIFVEQIKTYLSLNSLNKNDIVQARTQVLKKKKSHHYGEKEYNYRSWGRQNNLLLNHDNDLSTTTLNMNDPITFPDYISKCPASPHYSLAFSSIKRDFCFARFMAYEGIAQTYDDFEEKDLYLSDDLSNFLAKLNV